MIDLSIIIPCYNEEKNIPLILEKFSKIIKDKMELILVDNGSTDNTEKVLNEELRRYKFARKVVVKKNIGYGHGIITGLKAAKGEFLAWTHADLQTDPEDVISAYQKIRKLSNPEMVYIKGKRKKRPFIDSFFTKGMSIIASVMLKTNMDDINAQPNLFHRSFFFKMKNPPNDFSLDLYSYYLAKKKGLNIVKIPVDFSSRIHGISHWNTTLKSKWKFILRTMKFTVDLRKSLICDGDL